MRRIGLALSPPLLRGLLLLTLVGCRSEQGGAIEPRPSATPTTATDRVAAPSEPDPLPFSAAQRERLATEKLVDVPFQFRVNDKPEWQQKMFRALERAAAALDEAYWLQQHPSAPGWYDEVRRNSAVDRATYRLFQFGGAWGRFGSDAPLDRRYGKKPLGRNLYPADLTRAEFEQYLAAHPQEAPRLLSPYTVIRRDGAGLRAVPYHQEFEGPIRRAAYALTEAAEASHEPDLSAWLLARAEALESDRYVESDSRWVRLGTFPLDAVIGPYEVSEDEFWGVKTAYEMVVGWVDPEETAKLQSYAAAAPLLERELPWDGAASKGVAAVGATLVALTDAVRSGDAAHSGYTFVATNLPNDPAIQQQVGTRKLFLMTAMTARVESIVRPIANRVVAQDQLPWVTPRGYLHGTALHEVAHALGPKGVSRGERTISINEALRDNYGPIEECKATMAGFCTIPALVTMKRLDPDLIREIYVTELAGIFRDMRLGEAHAQASTIELNWHLEKGAVAIDPDGRFRVVLERWPESVRGLARELLRLEANGDHVAAGAFIDRYGKFPAAVQAALQKVADLPSELLPVFVED